MTIKNLLKFFQDQTSIPYVEVPGYLDGQTSTQGEFHNQDEGDNAHSLIDPKSGASYTGEEPYEGKEFVTQEDAYNFYNAYARKTGFRIRKEAGSKSTK